MISKVSILAIVISFCTSALLGPFLIPCLKRLKVGQTVREDGPAGHLKKNGTPTMGGLLILLAALAGMLPFVGEYPLTAPILFLTAGFGCIGFLDDYIKVVCRRSRGLSALQKIAGQLVVTGIFASYLLYYTDVSLAMKVPFGSGRFLDFGIWNLPILFFIVLGTANGVNLTDGLDGLAGSVTVIVAVFFTVVAIGTGSGIEPATCAVTGALLGFLLFNVHPAEVFMGDTGSLALGGFVAACGCLMQMQLFIALAGLIYLAEALTVILQVGYFKLTGGRRLFKMAPLHHHFELCGWPETKISALFTIVTALMCLAALMGVV